MSDTMQIPTGERGVVRLFALDVDADEAKAMDVADVARALGAETLDPDFVEIFEAGDVAEIGLSAYLMQGAGIPEAQIASDRARLDALRGPMVVVTSGAFGGRAQAITPHAPLRWLGSWSEEMPPVHFDALPDASAHTPIQPVQLTDVAPPMEEGDAGPTTTPAQRRIVFAIVAAIAVFGVALALLVMSLHG